MPEQSISHGITTFVAQNRGAKKEERLHKGFRDGLCLEFLYWVLICGTVLLLRKPIVGLFVTGEDARAIVMIGAQYLGTMAFFYIFPAFTNGFQGFYRGMGMMKMTLLGTFIQTTLRVIFTWILAPRMGIYGVAIACACGWSVMLLVEIPYYFKVRRAMK